MKFTSKGGMQLVKEKLTPEEIAWILADAEHGEITTCENEQCTKCILNKKLPKEFKLDITICSALTIIGEYILEGD